MEKDLRDAYAALKLLRADLVQTRRDKRALEASLTHLKAHGPPPSAAQIRESRETQQMQHEDARAQLWRQASIYESRLAEMEIQLLHNNCQNKEATPEVEDNQQGEEEEVEKLALLNKLHSLTATVKQQTQTMLTQQAAFALQKGELETTLETHSTSYTSEAKRSAEAKEHEAKLAETGETYASKLEKVESELKEARKQLAALETSNAIEQKEQEAKLEEALGRLRDQEQQAMTLRDLENNFADVQSKLTAAETKLADGAKKYEQQLAEASQKLLDQEQDHKRHASSLRDMENDLAGAQTQLADTEAKLQLSVKMFEEKLAQTSQTCCTT
ncbi:Exosome complex exonuclease RRP46 [Phytophthora nicotianae]|uniref:Exosome complex exonuclease RRP46 n=1 Tax=Phytophthora nicotianae TaxID=4792 RepID=A0A0W8D3Y0_PHYNI|nr:Exosome complex exonuclease RRP46 [Phytophthora nicotianae]